MSLLRPALVLWTVGNAAVSLWLAAAWAARVPPAPRPQPVAAAAWSVEGGRVLLRFPRPVAEPGPADPALVAVDPPLPMTPSWLDGDRLELRPAGPWPAETAVGLVVDPARLPATAAPVPPFRAVLEPLAIQGLTIAEEPAPGRPWILRLDLGAPVEPADPAWLRAEVPGAGPVPVTAEPDGADAWRLTVGPDPRLAGPPPWTVAVTVAAGLRVRGGGRTALPLHRTLRIADAVAVQSLTADARGILLRTDAYLPLPGTGAIAIDPPQPLVWQREGSALRARGELAPGAVVRVRLPAGFPGRGRLRIADPVDAVLAVPPAPPGLALPQQGSVLSRHALPELAVAGTGLDRLRWRLQRVLDHQTVRFSERGRWSVPETAFGPARGASAAWSAGNESGAVQRIALDAAWGGPLDPGWYRVVVLGEAAGRTVDSANRLVQVTDLGITARWAGRDAAVRVAGLADGGPAAGATVAVLARTGALLARGHTDADGLVRLRLADGGRPAALHGEPALVVAEHGQDRAVLEWSRAAMAAIGPAFAGVPDPPLGITGWAQGDRGSVRPGEVLRGTAILRRDGAAPADLPLTVRWRGPGGGVVAEQRLRCPGDGLVALELPLPPGAPHGPWSAVVLADDPDPEADPAEL
ncbi:MAG: hypothetical protein RLZZ127_1588, partial [Planctomycetota bacterium]